MAAIRSLSVQHSLVPGQRFGVVVDQRGPAEREIGPCSAPPLDSPVAHSFEDSWERSRSYISPSCCASGVKGCGEPPIS